MVRDLSGRIVSVVYHSACFPVVSGNQFGNEIPELPYSISPKFMFMLISAFWRDLTLVHLTKNPLCQRPVDKLCCLMCRIRDADTTPVFGFIQNTFIYRGLRRIKIQCLIP